MIRKIKISVIKLFLIILGTAIAIPVSVPFFMLPHLGDRTGEPYDHEQEVLSMILGGGAWLVISITLSAMFVGSYNEKLKKGRLKKKLKSLGLA